MRYSKEVKVGLLAIVSLTILYVGFYYLKGIDFLEKNSEYYAVYDNIDGLTISNPVVINGLRVGRVNEIQILQNRNNKILVELNVNSDIKLTKGTLAKLVNLTFLGDKAIELVLSDSTMAYYKSGDTLRAQVVPGFTESLKANAGPVAANLETTITKINTAFDNFNKNNENISNTLKNLSEISAQLNEDFPSIKSKLSVLLDNLNKNSNQLTETLTGLKPILNKMDQVADSLVVLQLNEMLEKTQVTVDNLNANLVAIKDGTGTLGKLVYNDSLYNNLNSSAKSLDLLLTDLRERPKRYVHFSLFGGGGKDKKKDENPE